MKLATVRSSEHATRCVRVEDDGTYIDLATPDVGAFLVRADWREEAGAASSPTPEKGVGFAPLVANPGKILCVGLNYAPHIQEMGRDLPEYPTLFAKFSDALTGPNDPILLPPESESVDWEAELVVVIGRDVRRADERQASEAIAGFTVSNDVTMRDWQYRTKQWLQGKTFEASTPLGPVLVTPDQLPGGTRPSLGLRTILNGETVQEANTSELVFDPVELVQYISRIVTLRAGDVVLTGTPGGVGHARTPPRFLSDGDVLVTEIDGIGKLENKVVRS